MKLASGSEGCIELVLPWLAVWVGATQEMGEVFGLRLTQRAEFRCNQVVAVCDFSGWQNVVAQLHELDMARGHSIKGLFVRLEVD